MTIYDMPLVNASLNGLAGIFLFFGWRAIKKGNRQRHQKFMIAALCASTAFLICYLTYHFMIPGVTRYQREGVLRIIYFFVLGTHTPLAGLVPPLSLIAVWHAYKGNFEKHVRITRWLLPVWMYVSVTGVLIYLMLYVF